MKYSVKGPAGIGTILGMTGIIVSQSILAARSWDRMNTVYAMLSTILLCSVVLLVALYRALKQSTEIYLRDGHLLVNGHVIPSTEMKAIMIRGYFYPVIGILPHGRRIVPMAMVFRYSRDEDRGIADLRHWAKTNDVKMVNKWFQTWL